MNVRIKGPKVSPPPPDAWSRKAPRALAIPHAARFDLPDINLDALRRATPEIFERPMAERDPLPRWTFGRVTLLGDAAHPMYPVGSNGASQAVLDARCLADGLDGAERPRAALWANDAERRPKTAEVVMSNREGGPEGVIDEVEKRAPSGFTDREAVMPRLRRGAWVRGHAAVAGFQQVRRAAPVAAQ